MRPTSALHIAALFLALQVPARGQEPLPLAPGARIKVRAQETHIGTLLTLDSVALVLRQDGMQDTLSVPRETIRRLEVSAGRKSAAGKGARIGGIAGGGLGLLAGAAAAIENPCDGPSFCLDLFGPEDIPLFVVVAGGTGAVVGALIGALGRTDRWTEVPVDGLRVGIVPLRDGTIGFALSRTF